jgi:two-component system NarL family sensor kinase
MKPKTKFLCLAVVPLLLATVAIGTLLFLETSRLQKEQAALLERTLLNAKRDELRNYISLALTSINHIYGAGRDDDAAKEEVKAILAGMNFGADGYFFVYTTKGVNVVHPRQAQMVGTDQWLKRDADGVWVIQELVARAQEGGGFQRYLWPKPSTGQETRKLSYAVLLPRWNWMLGTGIYLDDVDAAAAKMRDNLFESVQATLLWMAVVGVVAALSIFAAGLALNISDQRLAERKLKALAHRVVSSQEEERARVSRELHDHICQLLVSIKYQFELVGHRLAHRERVTAIEKEIAALSGAISEVRRISHDLRPALLDNLGLVAALEHIGNELAQRSGMQVSVSSNLSEQQLPELYAVNLFRVAQEALRNVERHARANQIDIRLEKDKDRAVLEIFDDGQGFDVHNVEVSKEHGIGLTNMRERVERNGGVFELFSRRGHTLLKASFPLTALA